MYITYILYICIIYVIYIYFFLRCGPTRAMISSFLRFLHHTQWRTTVGRTPLDEWSARRRDLYLTTHNTHNRQTSMPPAGFEPTISAGERPQTYALDRTATETGIYIYIYIVDKLCLVHVLHLYHYTKQTQTNAHILTSPLYCHRT